MASIENITTEQHIIEVAKQAFIEKGFAETSMSDIAARAGINRPVLHYYFRTKERLYETVFSHIVSTFIPAIHKIVIQNKPLPERISDVVDVYFGVVEREPLLPLFVVREIQRDIEHFRQTILKMEMGEYVYTIRDYLLSEMEAGRIKQIPLEYFIYTFYGLVFAPFLVRPLTDVIFKKSEEEKRKLFGQWKLQIVSQLETLLCVEK